ncbi:ATP-dependent DNA helicase RecQ [Novipirellula aureliae]|uniref:ATP-dependent DNA helicase RecQ n=1 Tax=Novipirellula aureliae TaxID=2527966 RepID=A0A5C6E9V1_9BACT|nr:RecQ family ATP-dependent DNA helicase [Novipirellula aureliae]TWU45782.1 ATP-dependent DNA helicase RecQ [Novipirellula aureliae]
MDAKEVLQQRFGLRSFRRGQKSVITRLLNGRNVAAVFPTGGGKSLCYQLPSQLLPGTTVVVSPLIALMKDQCDALQSRGISAARFDSNMSTSEFRMAMKGIRCGETKIMYVAPERFFNERFIASLGTLRISLFAIDEAHCISQWGHNFRPDYLKLAKVAESFSAERVLALTATATEKVLQDIRSSFKIRKPDAIRAPFYRSNLHLRSVILEKQDQYAHLLKQLRHRKPGSTLIYVTTQRSAEEIAERLTEDGIASTAYHAGLETERRMEIQNSFIESKAGVVVATIAFGMGIDKSNIRYVYHFNPPKSLEAYAQEVGRAGRDGKVSLCEMMVVPEDRIVLDNFTYGDTVERRPIEQLIERLSGLPDSFFVSHYRLSYETDIRLSVLRTLITYLELEGYLEATSPRYESYKVQPQLALEQILAKVPGPNRDFSEALLSMLTKGRTWFLLNVTLATKRLGVDRNKIIETIESMSEKGWLEVKVGDLNHGYRWLKRIKRPKGLAERLASHMLERETLEVRRLDQVLSLAKADACQAQALSKHFGETTLACGHCSYCQNEGPFEMPPPVLRSIGRGVKLAIAELIEKYPEQLSTPRDQARFLCGLSSPQMVRKRMTREAYYGICSEMPFADVLSELS